MLKAITEMYRLKSVYPDFWPMSIHLESTETCVIHYEISKQFLNYYLFE